MKDVPHIFLMFTRVSSFTSFLWWICSNLWQHTALLDSLVITMFQRFFPPTTVILKGFFLWSLWCPSGHGNKLFRLICKPEIKYTMSISPSLMIQISLLSKKKNQKTKTKRIGSLYTSRKKEISRAIKSPNFKNTSDSVWKQGIQKRKPSMFFTQAAAPFEVERATLNDTSDERRPAFQVRAERPTPPRACLWVSKIAGDFITHI